MKLWLPTGDTFEATVQGDGIQEKHKCITDPKRQGESEFEAIVVAEFFRTSTTG